MDRYRKINKNKQKEKKSKFKQICARTKKIQIKKDENIKIFTVQKKIQIKTIKQEKGKQYWIGTGKNKNK